MKTEGEVSVKDTRKWYVILVRAGRENEVKEDILNRQAELEVDELISGLFVKMAGDNATDLMKNVEKAEFYLMNASYGPELRKIMWDRKQGLG